MDHYTAIYASGLMEDTEPWRPEVEALADLSHEDLIARAPGMDTKLLRDLLARLVRGERFCEGLLDGAAESGLLGALLHEIGCREDR